MPQVSSLSWLSLSIKVAVMLMFMTTMMNFIYSLKFYKILKKSVMYFSII